MGKRTEAGPVPDDIDEDAEEVDEDEDEDEDETEGVSDVSPPPVALRPLRPRARPAPPPFPAGALSNFGGVPQSATHWAMTRRTPIGSWEPLSWAPPGSSVAVREWPIAELSETNVEARWGLGSYQVKWIAPTENGGRRYLRSGQRIFDIVRPTPEASPSSPSSPSSPTPDPFGGAFQLMDLIERRTDGKLDSLVKLSGLLGGGSSRGISPEEMRAIIRDERDAAAAARRVELEAVEARWAARLAELEAEDEDGPDLAGAVIGAAPRMKGSGWLANTLNFAQANPELAKVAVQGGLPIVLSAVSSLAALFTPKVPAPPPAPVEPPRPRARPPIVTPPPRSNGSPWAPQTPDPVPVPGAELGGVVPSS